jgi:prolyl-tRNA synthetase
LIIVNGLLSKIRWSKRDDTGLFFRYTNVIASSDMVDQSPVRGCMVIKPWGMAIWDSIRADLDVKIRDSGAQNAYFPLFIPMSFLSKEAEHVEGFAKECAVVTHHRLCKSTDGKGLMPDPDAELDVRYIFSF